MSCHWRSSYNSTLQLKARRGWSMVRFIRGHHHCCIVHLRSLQMICISIRYIFTIDSLIDWLINSMRSLAVMILSVLSPVSATTNTKISRAYRVSVWPISCGMLITNDIVGCWSMSRTFWSPSSDYVELLDLVLTQSLHDRYWGTGTSYIWFLH